jgi:hypothetical protein
MELSAPEDTVPSNIDLALHVKAIASIVQNRERQKHVRTSRCYARHKARMDFTGPDGYALPDHAVRASGSSRRFDLHTQERCQGPKAIHT